MLALRAEVLAKSELRLKISAAADSEWRELIERAYKGASPIDRVDRINEERGPAFAKIISHDNLELEEEIIPAYRKMLDLFKTQMHLAEFSTIQYFPVLLEFVEIWNRNLGQSIPVEVVLRLNNTEQRLHPFYQDLAAKFALFQHALQERRSWWRRLPVVRVLGNDLVVNPFAAIKDDR